MSYYPLSQIKSNLYTNGGELVYDIKNPLSEYTGYYYKTSDGKYFTGRNPQDLPNVEIYSKPSLDYNKYPNAASDPILNYIATNGGAEVIGGDNTEGGDPNVLDYMSIKNIDSSQVNFIPQYSPTYPTSQDYQVGEFRRFFCKKTNEIQYIEIDPKQYSLLTYKDPQILWQLYYPFNIPWTISGPIGDIYAVNKNIVELAMKQLKLPRFNDYLKNDYVKYFDI
jgi:hypothetical protein